jgi:glycosyltransferase involved in cell wall biosynthesis
MALHPAHGHQSFTRPHIGEAIVAVPARNEAERIVRCLESIRVAVELCPSVRPIVVVAVDSSADATAQLAREFDAERFTPLVVEGWWGCAAGARRAAIEAGLQRSSQGDRHLWIANTDADCEVPAVWLATQIRYAERGVLAVAGIVELSRAHTLPALYRAFQRMYHVSEDSHRHLHAANLGLRGDAYRKSGGWQARVALGEEHEFAQRLAASGVSILQTSASRVTTSSRLSGRASGGFSDMLRKLLIAGSDDRNNTHVVPAPPEIRFLEGAV